MRKRRCLPVLADVVREREKSDVEALAPVALKCQTRLGSKKWPKVGRAVGLSGWYSLGPPGQLAGFGKFEVSLHVPIALPRGNP